MKPRNRFDELASVLDDRKREALLEAAATMPAAPAAATTALTRIELTPSSKNTDAEGHPSPSSSIEMDKTSTVDHNPSATDASGAAGETHLSSPATDTQGRAAELAADASRTTTTGPAPGNDDNQSAAASAAEQAVKTDVASAPTGEAVTLAASTEIDHYPGMFSLYSPPVDVTTSSAAAGTATDYADRVAEESICAAAYGVRRKHAQHPR